MRTDSEAHSSVPESAKSDRLRDYVSGKSVRATKEEREAVQVFARRLVEDYGYPLRRIRTHPQFRVRARPSDEGRSYPVDIAVFSSDEQREESLQIIVECKEPEKRKGIGQLKSYLQLSPAEIGVWFNGNEHAYIRKYLEKGSVRWEDLPTLPRFGQRLEDIGLFKRKDLKKPSDLKSVFRDLRNHLAGNATGMTRDEAFAQEIINLLFCKIYDELNTAKDDTVGFRCGHSESPGEVRKRVVDLFSKVKQEYSDVFEKSDAVSLDPNSLVYVVGELQGYAVTEADRDAIGDAFEVFIGPALRGQEGQFFTPRNVVKMVVDILDPRPDERVLDPACGSGGFLIGALTHVWAAVEDQGAQKGWTRVQIERKKIDVATRYFRGIDKDSFLSKVTKAYMAIVGDGRGGVFCENSLEPTSSWSAAAQTAVQLGTFDVILTNPPFGKKIRVKGGEILSQYRLGHVWKRDKETQLVSETDELRDDQPPQVLFLERCLQLLRAGGRLGIVLPEAIVGMPTYEYVVAYLNSVATVQGVISMPEPLFKTSGKGGTHAKTCVLIVKKGPAAKGDDYPIFMADAKWCGHDTRGNPTLREEDDGTFRLLDDMPLIARRYRELMAS